MGLLSNSSRGGLLTRRGLAFAGVAVLHVVALAFLLRARTQVDEIPQVTLMQVALLQEDLPREAPPPEIVPKLELPPPVQIVIPQVEIPELNLVEPRAITVTQASPPPAATPAVVAIHNDAPVMLNAEEVDYLRAPTPHYPRAAKQARLQGTVLLWVLIDAEGRPQQVRVQRSSGYEQLDREGCDAVSHALFKPYRHQGVARSAQAIVPIEFTLAVRTASRN